MERCSSFCSSYPACLEWPKTEGENKQLELKKIIENDEVLSISKEDQKYHHNSLKITMIPPKVVIVFPLLWKTDQYYHFHPGDYPRLSSPIPITLILLWNNYSVESEKK